MPNSRIPRDITHFVQYMNDTDDWQLLTDPATGNPRWQNWGWTATDSGKWTAFRNKADTLFAKYSNKKFREADITEKLHLLIKDVVEYDHLEKLLDSIGATKMPPAVLDDYEHFRIKRGTVVADATPTRVADSMGEPAIVLKKTLHLMHLLAISNPEHETKGRGKHIKEVQVWRAIVAAAIVPVPVPRESSAPDDDAYRYVGEALRGTYKSEFSTADEGKTAWYKARYKNTQGKLGDFSPALSVKIM